MASFCLVDVNLICNSRRVCHVPGIKNDLIHIIWIQVELKKKRPKVNHSDVMCSSCSLKRCDDYFTSRETNTTQHF